MGLICWRHSCFIITTSPKKSSTWRGFKGESQLLRPQFKHAKESQKTDEDTEVKQRQPETAVGAGNTPEACQYGEGTHLLGQFLVLTI
jgi:hypothetical protein